MTLFTSPSRAQWRCCLLGAALAAAAAHAGAAEIALVLSADTEGCVEPCGGCPGDPGSGGLARRASLVQKLRTEPGAAPCILADAGNFLFGAESLESGGKVIVSAYEAMAYDAVNVSWRDFRLGKAATLALLSQAKLGCISANLLDAARGDLLFKPYVVMGAAPGRVAVIGVSEAPAGLDFLPHLKAQLGGVRVRPPLEALGEWLPRARAESDIVVLLFYGSPAGLRSIRESSGSAFAAVLVGGARPEELGTSPGPPAVAATPEHGKGLALVRLPPRGAAGGASVTQLAVDASIPPAPEIEKIVSSFREPAAPVAR